MPNHLVTARSPYLQQHANNPVDWFEWNTVALTKAAQENKPILLSIGYSACHWCHVMAHESFEDEETADLMNQLFINIKVDREERPDLDKIYQTSQSLLTQRTGGWPLTMFLDPKTHAPFFGGTYFPKEPRGNLPSFKTVLTSISDYFQKHTDQVYKQGMAVQHTLGEIYAANQQTRVLSASILKTTFQSIANQYDAEYGGFGAAPKFPHPGYLDYLIYYGTQINEDPSPAINIAIGTLKKMVRGGIYDQLGGGFYRYSVDKYWLIPHFEKMLYDNGSLLSLLADAYQITADHDFSQRAQATADWVIHEMQSPEGGYYSSLDADSEGQEGTFYLWTKSEIETLLDKNNATLATQHFGMDQAPNFEGKWHLYIHQPIPVLAKQHAIDEIDLSARIEQSQHKLLTHRNQRKRPGRDDKILTAWNALMIKGMAKAAIALAQPSYGDSAEGAYDFIRNTLYANGKLHACWNQTLTEKSVFLDDFAFLLDATLYLLQYNWHSDRLHFALQLADTMIEQFEDREHGGYFFTPEQQKDLLQRPRVMHDEAMVSGYGVATIALTRLGFLCGREDYLRSANRALQQASTTISQSPAACASLIQAYATYHTPAPIIILRGQPAEIKKWQQVAYSNSRPSRLCFAIANGVQNLPPSLAEKKCCDKNVVAYICEGTHCLPPMDNFDQYATYLKQ